jgi:hypothetical protein
MIIKGGNINTSAINVPGGYVQVIAPPPALQGAPSNIIGIVGTAQWGPVNSPFIIGDYNGFLSTFGPLTAGANDLGTQLWLAMLQGANNFRMVRVTDGTDMAATLDLLDTAVSPAIGAILTSIYTGTYGNNLKASISAGTITGTYNVTISMPNGTPEQFTNIGGVGATFWANLVAAVNNGQSGIRGPSLQAIASIGGGIAAPDVVTTYTASAGTDGNTTITNTVLVGTDGTSRTGMYALRNTGCAVAFLAGNTSVTSWPLEIALANAEGWEAILVGPSGQSIAAAITAKATAAVDDTSFKVLMGDWAYFLDSVNGQTRLVSPQGISAGIRAVLSPEQSVLNKQVYGIIATQKTSVNQVYSYADLSALATARIDVISSPSPGGAYFSHLLGINGSSNVVMMGDEYTTLTNYLSKSVNSQIGIFVGQLQTPGEQRTAQDFIEDWLQTLMPKEQGGTFEMIQGFDVQLNASNNPQNTVELGFQIANVSIQYFGTVRYFIVNLVGGSSVKTTVIQ